MNFETSNIYKESYPNTVSSSSNNVLAIIQYSGVIKPVVFIGNISRELLESE